MCVGYVWKCDWWISSIEWAIKCWFPVVLVEGKREKKFKSGNEKKKGKNINECIIEGNMKTIYKRNTSVKVNKREISRWEKKNQS